MLKTEEIDKIIQDNEDYIIHWIENGKTLKWCAEYLGLSYSSFCNGIKRDGIDWKYVKENGKKTKSQIDKDGKASLGEKAIIKILDKYGFYYQREYSFKDFKYSDTNGTPRFDFAIFTNNGQLRYLIEYDGQQHFKSVNYFGGKQGYEQRILHDKEKNFYCKTHNIPLIRINIPPEEITIGDLLI